MKRHRQIHQLIGLVCLALFAPLACAQAAEVDTATQQTVKKLLTAVANNDHASFVADGTEQLKAAPQEPFATASRMFGPRLKQGYEMAYLTHLRQRGYQVHLWKLTFSDGGDDVVVRVVLKEGKVAGFFFQ